MGGTVASSNSRNGHAVIFTYLQISRQPLLGIPHLSSTTRAQSRSLKSERGSNEKPCSPGACATKLKPRRISPNRGLPNLGRLRGVLQGLASGPMRPSETLAHVDVSLGFCTFQHRPPTKTCANLWSLPDRAICHSTAHAMR
jgi:hypothetical protein